MSKLIEDRKEQGFTLIELLIAIVVVGILAAVAIVGIAGLTNTGQKSACKSSADAATAASAAFYANQSPNVWPTSIEAMATESTTPVNTPRVFTPPDGVTYPDDTHMALGTSWTMVMTPDAVHGPTFTCP